MRKICAAGLVLALCLSLAACWNPQDGLSRLCAASGLDLSSAELLSDRDSHGGFHGDGTRLAVLAFREGPDAAALEQAGWRPLPLDETAELAVYGVTAVTEGAEGILEVTAGPCIPYEEDMEPIPKVQNGYYFFEDRYPADGPEKDRAFSDRGAFNFTAAVYDSDAGILYYCRVDT